LKQILSLFDLPGPLTTPITIKEMRNILPREQKIVGKETYQVVLFEFNDFSNYRQIYSKVFGSICPSFVC